MSDVCKMRTREGGSGGRKGASRLRKRCKRGLTKVITEEALKHVALFPDVLARKRPQLHVPPGVAKDLMRHRPKLAITVASHRDHLH